MTLARLSQFCPSALLIASMAIPKSSAVAQELQRNPIVMHERNHVTTPVPFREMTPVPWHNLSRVMPEHDRAPQRHISNVPDTVAQGDFEGMPLVGTLPGLSFDGITDAQ